MTVKELIEKLSKLNPNDEVVVEHPAHDYWRNTLAREPRYPFRERVVGWSEYHNSDKCLDEKDGHRPDGRRVVSI